MTIEEKLQEDAIKARKTGDMCKVNAINEIKKLIMEYKTSPKGNRNPDEKEIIKILQGVAKRGKENGDMYAGIGKDDLAASEYAEYEVAKKYLPKMLTEGEVTQIVTDTITDMGATTIKDMGKVMGFINKTYAGQVDGAMVSKIVKSYLS